MRANARTESEGTVVPAVITGTVGWKMTIHLRDHGVWLNLVCALDLGGMGFLHFAYAFIDILVCALVFGGMGFLLFAYAFIDICRARVSRRIARLKETADICVRNGQTPEALRILGACAAIHRNYLQEDSIEYMNILRETAEVARQVGDNTSAEAYYLSALAVFNRHIVRRDASGRPSVYPFWAEWIKRATDQLSAIYLEQGKREAREALSVRLSLLAVVEPGRGVALAPASLWDSELPAKLRKAYQQLRLFQSTPSPEEDTLDCNVYSRPSAQPGDTIFVQVFVLLADQQGFVDTMAKQFDATAQQRATKSLEVAVHRGSRLTFQLFMPGCTVDEAIQSLVWRGRAQSVQFEVRVPCDRTLGEIVGRVIVSNNAVPVGNLKFKISIDTARSSKDEFGDEPTGTTAQLYRKAFISYAATDRAEVIKRLQMLRIMGVAFYQDLIDITPGDRWENKIYSYIDKCDLFLLFWSRAARDSEWVRREILYALRRKHGDDSAPPDILPVIIEGPPPPEPPVELAYMHFNDYLIYLAPSESSP
jgi:hypothetical protein